MCKDFISCQKSQTHSNISELFHSRHICHCELPKIYLESIFAHPLNLECPSTSATLSLADLLWQVFSDLIMTADAQTLPSLLAIGRYLFFSLLIVECSDAQFTSSHQQVSQRNEPQGIESRDWQDSGRRVCEGYIVCMSAQLGAYGVCCLQ